jgi:hypothetical protein
VIASVLQRPFDGLALAAADVSHIYTAIT